MAHMRFTFVILTVVTVFGEGYEFLKAAPKVRNERVSEEDIQTSLLEEVEESLGTGSAAKRLQLLEAILQPMYTALPKNEHGNLGHSTVRYALHRLFIMRHGWHIKGLSRDAAISNVTSPLGVLKDQVPSYIQSLFEKRLGEKGVGLHDLAVIAATMEHLIHKEVVNKLGDVYASLQILPTQPISEALANKVLDTYMMAFSLGEDLKKLSFAQVIERVREMPDLYVGWSSTQKFVRRIRDNVTMHVLTNTTMYLDFAALTHIVEVVGEEFGRSRGLASKMLLDLVTNKLAGVRYIEATVCPSNVWSRELFIRLGRKLQNANVHWETTFVPSEAFQQDPGSRVHEQEDLVRIGPFGLREDEIGDEISFYVRDLDDVEAGGDYKRGALGKWESRRYVTRKHGLGFSFHHTIMYEGQPSFQWYPNHVESVYISEGEGTIELVGEGSPHHFEHLIDTGKLYKLKPGTIYVLRGERHILTATSPGGMHCMCVFNPPATGKEDHNEKTGAYPVIADDGVAYESYGSDLVPLIFKPPRAFADGSRGRLADDRKV